MANKYDLRTHILSFHLSILFQSAGQLDRHISPDNLHCQPDSGMKQGEFKGGRNLGETVSVKHI